MTWQDLTRDSHALSELRNDSTRISELIQYFTASADGAYVFIDVGYVALTVMYDVLPFSDGMATTL